MTQQSMANMRSREISDLLPQVKRVIGALPGPRERNRPKRSVTEGFMTLTDYMRPEATLLIGLCCYALQSQTCVLYELMHQDLR
jgi:hypothetical protein